MAVGLIPALLVFVFFFNGQKQLEPENILYTLREAFKIPKVTLKVEVSYGYKREGKCNFCSSANLEMAKEKGYIGS